ncbi:EAL domain-containing protein [Spiribacter halobius]|uniref:EAL domain-containing protein n=1 Tax=Sediminicurvatus halobius TaxID=2182432 RepID=A0A2U2N7U4_9GAMM|nr:EAL domain-containing protein [Spiribacter halobius]PWG65158.1 hypothetical protein DEM34_02460 [Spiribacter halobius]UEX78891.1 EAL domain-containing protein [Spiribacter halobius]
MTAAHPVYVCTGDAADGQRLVTGLRTFGLRARGFASCSVLANAARAQAPAAIVADWNEAAAAHLAGLPGAPCLVARVPQTDLNLALTASEAGVDAVLDPGLPVGVLRDLVWTLLNAGAPTIALVTDRGDDDALAERLEEAGGKVRVLRVGDALLGELVASAPELVLLRTGIARRLARLIEQTPGLAGAEVRPVGDTPALTLVQRAAALGRRRAVAALAARHDLASGGLPPAPAAVAAASLRERAAAVGEVPAVIALDTDEATLAAGLDLLRARLPALAATVVLGERTAAALTAADEAALARQVRAVREAAGAELPGLRVGHAVIDGALPLPETLFSGADDGGNAQGPVDRALERRIRRALEDDALRLVYQPISSLSGHPGSFFEVFVRLADGGGDALPADFVRTVREGGHAPALDRGVLERALEVLATHDTDGPTLFVKLFPESLEDPELTAWLGERMEAHGVAPARLVLQLSHPTLCARRERSQAAMQALRRLGCRLAVEHYDDSLEPAEQTLQGPAFDFLKLSHRLTDELVQHPERVERVREIARSAADRDIRTIACLVQDAANLSVLWQAGVAYIQGYFMQAPEAIFASAPQEGA